ncbi:MAG: hypothetical protein IMW86_04325 [Hydrogenibacillus sp.]|nr:hypothetical protein [Hydrogenibacillus sp.]
MNGGYRQNPRRSAPEQPPGEKAAGRNRPRRRTRTAGPDKRPFRETSNIHVAPTSSEAADDQDIAIALGAVITSMFYLMAGTIAVFLATKALFAPPGAVKEEVIF